jgi:hypothetical protein
VSRRGASLICDNCGEEIPQSEHLHTWIGPVVAKGEAPRHYHLAREYPECRIVGGADPMPGELTAYIELKLAEKFTWPGLKDQPPSERVDQGMMYHFLAGDGYPSMAPVTPRQVAEVVAEALRQAGISP